MNLTERIPVSKNFYLDEYIPKETYLQAETKEELINLIDPRLFESDQMLRDVFGSATINNWWVGGNRNYSGWRPVNCKIGAKGSDHKFGKASDKVFKNFSAKDVRVYIRKNFKKLGITKIEDDITWVHTSVAKTDKSYLTIFYPTS